MKNRIDIILVEKGLAPSRAKAGAYINEGRVYVNGELVNKAGKMFLADEITIELKNTDSDYVSRGGLKLEKALSGFGICLENKICLDIGASTGGFTDCMLKHGATKVYAVDTGQNQLAASLKNDTRVICVEKANFRYMKKGDISESLSFMAADVSFISLKLILPSAYDMLENDCDMVCLIKPQFEAGICGIGKNGIVKDKKVHQRVLQEIVDFAVQIGFVYLHLDFSPIRGGKDGNIEYLLHLRKAALPAADATIDYKTLVERAHGVLE